MYNHNKLTPTQQRIYDAFRYVLENEGFQALGINRICEVAQVGKPLIYRYFDGMKGLIKLWAEDLDYWRDLTQPELQRIDEVAKKNGVNILVAQLIFSVRVVRRNPFLLELMRWKLIENNELTDVIHKLRETALNKLIEFMPQSETINSNILLLLLSNSLIFMVLQAEKKQDWNGLDLKSDATWDEVESHIAFIYEAIEEKIRREQ